MGVYNGDKFVHLAIESILNQTYKNVELIVINDGSTDRTSEILSRYEQLDTRLKVFNQSNQGLTRSLNTAISMCAGEFIARQDADDISTTDRLATQLQYLLQNRLDIVTARAQKGGRPAPNISVLKLFSRKGLAVGNVFIHGTFFGKSSVFKSIGYDNSFRFAQDYKFLLECFNRKVQIGCVVKPLYELNVHEDNISNKNKESQNRYVREAIVNYYGSSVYFDLLSKCRNKFVFKALKLLFLARFWISKKNNLYVKIL